MATWTKRQIVAQAYEEVGKADYEFDLQPDELQSALRKLDAMVATWASKGIRFGWGGGDGKGDIDAETQVPIWAVEALYLNLAIRIAPSFGKTLSQDTKTSARLALFGVQARCTNPPDRASIGYAGAGAHGVTNLPGPDDQIISTPGHVPTYGG